MKAKGDKRTAIFDATLDCISKHGFHNTSMSMIVNASSVSTGIVYHYFASKEEIIIELYKKIKQEAIKAMLDDYSEDQTFRERFRSIWYSVLEYHRFRPKETSFLEQFEFSPYLTPSLSEWFFVELKPISDLLAESIKNEIIKNLPIDMLVGLFKNGAVILAKKYKDNSVVIDEKLIEMTFDACWDAIKK